MKKLSLGLILAIIAVLLLLPSSVEAAKIETSTDEMTVGQEVEVKITAKTPVESVQFDLNFDNTKYQYVNGSVQSNLEYKASNLITNKTVRVVSFDTKGNKTNNITLRFKAIDTGMSVPFTVGGTIELGEDGGVGETFENLEVKVSKIEKAPDTVITAQQKKYLTQNGQVLVELPQTGEEVTRGNIKSLGVFRQLVPNHKVVPYALSDSEESISIADIKNEYGEITTTATNPIKTGDTFSKNNTSYTMIVYGDINKDGKVTSSDAIKIGKYVTSKTTQNAYNLDEYQLVAADVENDKNITEEDVKAVMNFILKLRVTETDTILNKYPKEDLPEYKLSNVNFSNMTVDYDEAEHEITVTGLPEGITASYTNNKGTNAGTYNAVATFELSSELREEYSAVSPATMEAQLIINKIAYQLPQSVKFENKTVVKDGEVHNIVVTGLPEGVTATYQNNDQTELGKYNVVATFVLSEELSQNYASVSPETMTANLKIVETPQPIGITTDGTNLTTGEISVNLYTNNPNRDDVIERDNYYYTIIPIKLYNEDGSTTKILGGDIGESKNEAGKKVCVYENASEEMLWSFNINGYMRNGYGGYIATTATEEVDAIGIALEADMIDDFTSLGGLTIQYYGLDQNDQPCIKETKINVNVIQNSSKVVTKMNEEKQENEEMPEEETQIIPQQEQATESAPVSQQPIEQEEKNSEQQITETKPQTPVENPSVDIQPEEPTIPEEVTTPPTTGNEIKEEIKGIETSEEVLPIN